LINDIYIEYFNLLKNKNTIKVGAGLLIYFCFALLFIIPSQNFEKPDGIIAGTDSIGVTECGCLNQANTEYILQNDVNSDGSCFTLAGTNSILDLNGHTVTYDNASPITVSNGSFENGTGVAATDWDFSAGENIERFAGSYINPVEVYEGSYGLKFTLPAADQYIRSTETVTLDANTTYSISASMYNHASDNASIYVKLVGTAVQATRSGKTWRGFSYTAAQITTGAIPETYTIEVGITGAGAEPAGTVYLDDVQVLRYRTAGVAQGAASWMSTKPLDLPCYGGANGSVVKNGTIIQGNAGSDRGYAVYIGANSVETNNLNINVHSTNARAISSDQEAKPLLIHDNVITNSVVTIGRREGFDGVSIYSNRPNATKIYNNTIDGGAQNGIVLEDFRGLTTPNEIYGNTISLTASRTNDFAINLWSDNSTSVHDNVIDCTQGTDGCRGIFTGGGATGTEIINNTVSVREVDRNQEYDGCTSAYGIQIEYASNVEVSGNTITAVADECDGYAFRTNPVDEGSGITGTNNNIHDNTFIGVKRNGTSKVASANFITDIQDLDVLTYLRNTVISDQYWFYFTANTSNIPMISTNFDIGTNPTSPYTPLFSYNPAPPGPSTVDVQFIDNSYEDTDAENAFETSSFVCSGSIYACAIGGGSAVDKYASFYYSWYLTATVRGNDNNPISGATVTAVDSLGTTRFTGTTDVNGVITAALPQWYNDASVLTQYNGYTINASANGQNASSGVTMDASKALTINLNTTGIADVTAPTISDVGVGSPGQTSATVNWTTNEPADSQVEYGLTASYGSSTTLSETLTTSHSQDLSGLTAGTLYHYRVKSSDTAENPATSGDYTFTTAAVPDTTPPTISAVTATSITTAGATITWTTNESSDSQIEYGTTTGYGSQTTINASLVTSHSQALSGLVSSTLYHYRVKSKDSSNNPANSSDYTFTTSTPADTTSPSRVTDLTATNN
jgi:hypothetical protein